MEKVNRRAGETMRRRKGETEKGRKLTDSPIPRLAPLEAEGFPSGFPDSKKKGFSLLELMMVITIMGILITSSLLFGNNFLNSTAAKNATRDIASVMRMAHSKAMTLRTNYYVVYDATNKIVWVQDLRGPDGKPGVKNVDDDNNGVVDETGELGWAGSDDFNINDPNTWNPLFGSERKLSRRVEIDSVNVEPEDYGGKSDYQTVTGGSGIGYLPFRWNGTSVSGSVRLQDSRGNNQYSVTVMYTTSRIRLYSFW